VVKVSFEDEACQFRARACQLDTGWPAANDDDGHQRVARFCVGLFLRALKGEQ
jgi:hypothetical protein